MTVMRRNVPALLAVAVTRVMAAVALLVLGYLAAALVGGAIPTNADWRPSEHGVTIWVESNGIHTGLVMPKVAAGVDWHALAPAADLRDPRYGRWAFIAIGWGEKDFYLGTPTWREFRPATAVRAVLGSADTLMHVEHVPGPASGARPIELTPDQYRRLAREVAKSFRRGGRRHAGYGPSDVFYDAKGRYDAIHTCNNWTGHMLSEAGVRIGWWTPLPVTVTAWF